MRKQNLTLTLIFGLLCGVANLNAQEAGMAKQSQTPPQPPAVKAQLAAMKKLDWLVGEWQGAGWIEFGPGNRHTFRQSETIRRQAGGLALVVEGLGKGVMAGGKEEAVIHNAFAVISYNDKTQQYRWFAMRAADGKAIDIVPQVNDNGYIWAFEDERAGNIRFTATLNAKGQWVETGEGSRDGKTWTKFFEMTLDRVK
jgi:hypothetical protein